MNSEFKLALNRLIENIKTDYIRWTSGDGTKELSQVNHDMIDEFCQNITCKVNKKYIKIISNGSVWGFIVKEDGEFPKGSILKAAGFNAPARNAPRGNIFDEDYVAPWTGAAYLR